MTALVRRIRSVRAAAAAEHDGRRRDDEVRAVMLADAEDVEPDLVGQLDLLDQVAQPLLGADHVPGPRVGRQLREGVDPDLHDVANTVPGKRWSRWLHDGG